MKKIHFLLFIIISLMITVSGCKSSKSISKDDESNKDFVSEVVLQEIADSYKTWNTFSTSGKISISGAISFSTSMQLKMVKDNCISISIRPILGIEVARVFINNDSAVVVNKMQKVYTSIELKDLAHILPADINDIQDIILARVFSLNDGTLNNDNINKFTVSTDIKNDGFLIAPRKRNNKFSYEFALNKNKQVTSLNVYPAGSSKQYTAVYSDHASLTTGSEAENITIDTTVKGKELSLELFMNSSKTKWDSNVDESISINKSYRKVSVIEFLTMLKSL